jgi:hypothetical protein
MYETFVFFDIAMTICAYELRKPNDSYYFHDPKLKQRELQTHFSLAIGFHKHCFMYLDYKLIYADAYVWYSFR